MKRRLPALLNSLNRLDNDETEERSKSVESQDFKSEKYRQFMRLLFKCWDNNSVDISVLKKFISHQNKEVAVPIDEKEVDLFLDMMEYEKEVLIDADESVVYSI